MWRFLYFTMSLILLIAFCLYLRSYYSNRITLGKIEWIACSDNLSKLKTRDFYLLGPCEISLWAKHPYIYGYYIKKNEKVVNYFIVDLEKEDVSIQNIKKAYFLHEFEKKGLDPNEITNFWSLKGQWGNTNRLELLLKNLKELH